MTMQISYRFHGVWLIAALAGCIVALNAWVSNPASAASAKEIDAGVDEGAITAWAPQCSSCGLGNRCSIQLSYGARFNII